MTNEKRIEIRCRRCNKLIAYYYLLDAQIGQTALNMDGLEFKCEKCKRILRPKNYTEQLLFKHIDNGILLI